MAVSEMWKIIDGNRRYVRVGKLQKDNFILESNTLKK